MSDLISRGVIAIVAILALCVLPTSVGWAVTSTSSDPFIDITNTATLPTPATPSPSHVHVRGASGCGAVTVTISGLTHTYPDDLDILLVGPFQRSPAVRQKVVLMSDVGSGLAVSSVTLVFDDAAGVGLPDSGQITSGTYVPSAYDAGSDSYGSAPSGPYSSTLGAFAGTNPNGTWDLYVMDDVAGQVGSIASWSVTVTPPAPPANDDVAAATVLSGATPSASGQTTYGATTQPGEPAHPTYEQRYSVWYKWVAPSSGQTIVGIVPGSNTFDTTLTAYTGPATGATIDALSEVAFNNDIQPGSGTDSAINLTTVAGTAYYLQVAGIDDTQTGDFALALSAPAVPVITSQTVSVSRGATITHFIRASNVPSGYSASNVPGWMTFDPATGELSGTATDLGTTVIATGATNAAGTGTGTLTVTVDAKPVITSHQFVSLIVGQAFSITITGLNDPTSFTAAPLPPGLAIDGATGVISGTPTTIGSTSSSLTLSNAAGTETTSMGFLVNPAAAPVVTAPSRSDATVGVPFSQFIVATNLPTEYVYEYLPPGLRLDADTGEIFGTPQRAGTIDIPLGAKNAFGTGIIVSTFTITNPQAAASDDKHCGLGSIGVLLALMGLCCARYRRSRRQD